MLNTNLQVMKEQTANTMSMFTPIQYSSIEGKGVTARVVTEAELDAIVEDGHTLVEVIQPSAIEKRLDPDYRLNIDTTLVDHRKGIEDWLQRRADRLKSPEKFVFFTFREDENNNLFVSWPVSGYQNIPSRIIHRDQRTFAAIRRLSKRSHIKAITVVGPMRTYDQYFPWIKAQYEV